MVNVDLLDQHYIQSDTYRKIESNILRFCAKNYVNLNNRKGFTYSFENRKEIITNRCGTSGYIQFCIYVLIYRIRKIFKPNDIS